MKYVFLFLVMFLSNNLFSQVNECDCVTIENNKLMLHVFSNPSCEKLSKYIEIRRIPDKNEKKITGYDMYSVHRDNCFGIDFKSNILPGRYLIIIEVEYGKKKKCKIEKYLTF